MRKRSKLEIVSDILFFIRKSGGRARPTHILYKANLSVPLLKTYLSELVRDEIVGRIVEGGRTVYTLTGKGMRFIGLLQKINSMTETIEIYRSKRPKRRQ